jgi:hypothetical protein
VAQETGARSRHRLAALSGSQIKATGFAGGYLLLRKFAPMFEHHSLRSMVPTRFAISADKTICYPKHWQF